MKVLLRFPIEGPRLAQWREQFPDVAFALCEGDEIPPEHRDAQVVVGGWRMERAMVESLPALRWVQATFTGVEGFLGAGLAEREVALTNFRGVAAPNIAEHVLATMLAFARGLPELLRRQARHEWLPYGQEPPTFELTGQRLGLVGLGEISREIALRAKRGFGVGIWATRRSSERPLPPCVDRVLPPDQLSEMLRTSDHVVLAAALTEETRNMIDAQMLARMKPSAHIYNVGRGELVDHEALVDALERKVIAGAALDVTAPEPLPPESPLWDMPNVLVTAHTAGPTQHYWDRGYAIFVENIRRFRAGQPLLNLVDQTLGY